jgi:hypothetical protein
MFKRFPFGGANKTVIALHNDGNGNFSWSAKLSTINGTRLVAEQMDSPAQALGVVLAAEIKHYADLNKCSVARAAQIMAGE